MTYLEAISCGVPVVATDGGDVREIVIDGATGFLARRSDFNKMASDVTKILMDKGLRKELRRNGRTHVNENFSYEAVLEKLI